MEYTVDALAKLSGVSARTIRYYDQIGLLPPARVSSSGYRIYGLDQVDRLQQILLYREMGLELNAIGHVLADPGFDVATALREHLRGLKEKRGYIDRLIETVERTIESREEGKVMSDKEKFEGFKKSQIEENERKYGEEIRAKYGEKTVEESNRKYMNMSQAQYDQMNRESGELAARLKEAVEAGIDPASAAGREIFELHKAWLSHTWTSYSAEAHKGVAQMYIDDERFTAYYDKETPGCAKFLRDAVCAHA